VAKSAPQPRGDGGPDAPVTDVTMHLLVSAQGKVENAEVVKPVREDLDAEAKKVVSGWVFEPGTCDGRAQEYKIDVTMIPRAGDEADRHYHGCMLICGLL
jgi:TonB family protein